MRDAECTQVLPELVEALPVLLPHLGALLERVDILAPKLPELLRNKELLLPNLHRLIPHLDLVSPTAVNGLAAVGHRRGSPRRPGGRRAPALVSRLSLPSLPGEGPNDPVHQGTAAV